MIYFRHKLLLTATSKTTAECREPGREGRSWQGWFPTLNQFLSCHSAASTSIPARNLWLRWNTVTPSSIHLSFLFSLANASPPSSPALPPLKNPRWRQGGWRGCGRLMAATATTLRQKPGARLVSTGLSWLPYKHVIVVLNIICIVAIHSIDFTLKHRKSRCEEYNTWFTECLVGNSTEVAIRTRLWALLLSTHVIELMMTNIPIKRACIVCFFYQKKIKGCNE